MSNADKKTRNKLKFDDFYIDYTRAGKSNNELVAMEIDKVLGGMAKDGRK